MGNRGAYGFSAPANDYGGVPTNIQGCLVWMDADQIGGHEGQVLNNLRNLAGPGRFSGVATFRQNFRDGKGAIEINQTRMALPLTIANPCTILYAAQMKAGGLKRRVLTSWNVNWLLGYWNGNMDSYYVSSGFVNQGSTASNAPTVYTGRQSATRAGIWNGTVKVAEIDITAAAPGGIQIGGLNANGGATEYSDFYFFELIMYPRLLSDNELAFLQTYLIAKWKI